MISMQLRKCCNHPYLIKGVEDNENRKVEKEVLALIDQGLAFSDRGKAESNATPAETLDNTKNKSGHTS